MKAWSSVQYPLSKGSGHVAGESTWCRSADTGTPNCVAHVGEVTPSVGEEGVCLFGCRSFVHHHGFRILLKSSYVLAWFYLEFREKGVLKYLRHTLEPYTVLTRSSCKT